MQINLIGGFLGSGKTTAITNAVNLLTQKNIKAGIITNDQGNYLVDTKFVQSQEIPSGQVHGGCFCCNYNQLNEQIDSMIRTYDPHMIFAETVGSCTDLISTVVKPLKKFKNMALSKVTFSSFADASLLLEYLRGNKPNFEEETVYIWEKQIEEAEILVINKIDLLTRDELAELKISAAEKFQGKKIVFQNSLDKNYIERWIDLLETVPGGNGNKSIEIDYNIYGKGEANLSWLDEEITFNSSAGNAAKAAYEFISNVSDKIIGMGLPVGHLKYFVSSKNKLEKISLTSNKNDSVKLPAEIEDSEIAIVLLNARIQAEPETLRNIVAAELDSISEKHQVNFEEENISYFQPSFPNPTHRILD